MLLQRADGYLVGLEDSETFLDNNLGKSYTPTVKVDDFSPLKVYQRVV